MNCLVLLLVYRYRLIKTSKALLDKAVQRRLLHVSNKVEPKLQGRKRVGKLAVSARGFSCYHFSTAPRVNEAPPPALSLLHCHLQARLQGSSPSTSRNTLSAEREHIVTTLRFHIRVGQGAWPCMPPASLGSRPTPELPRTPPHARLTRDSLLCPLCPTAFAAPRRCPVPPAVGSPGPDWL